MGVSIKQPSAGDEKIGQTEEREQLRGVFRQAFVARLAVLEQVLHDMKRMLNLGANAGLGMFKPLQQTTQGRCRQCLAFTWPHRHMPRHRALKTFLTLLNALLASLSEGIGFIAMK